MKAWMRFGEACGRHSIGMSTLRRRVAVALAASGMVVGVAGEVLAQPASPQGQVQILGSIASPATNRGDEVTLNFVNADIEAVVRTISEITGRNFVIDPKVKGTINIVSTRPVARDLVYPTLLSALRLQGITAIEGEGVTRIVPETDAKQYPPSGKNAGKAGNDQLVTRVIPLRYESAAPMVGILRPLVSPNNSVMAFTGNNTLVITDYAENVKRLEKVIASLDQPPAGEPLMVRLHNASALDMVPMLNKLLAENAAPAASEAQQKVTLVADPRSNSVLIRSDNSGRAERVRQLIEKLDVPGRPEGNIFIIYLKNADAQGVAQTLQGLLTGNSAGSGNGATNTVPITKPLAATLANAATALTASSMASTEALPFAPANGGNNGNVTFSANGITVQADSATNAIVVMAPEPVYNTIRSVVEKLDVPRAQVFIEALIVEMEADKAAEFGIQWQINSNSSGTRVIGGTNFGSHKSGQNIIDTSFDPTSVGQGLNIGIVDGVLRIPGVGQITNLGFMARALETQAKANILSTPTLLTMDNQEARIMVGQNVPMLTGQYSTTSSTSTVQPFQTYDRQDVGLMLRIKPQITEKGTVRLNIYQEVSRVMNANTTSANQSGPTLSKRFVDSAVAIDDSQIVVLGGLIEDRMEDGSDKVPLLGDIPWFGQFFRYDSRSRQKTNLLIFLKPTIVRSSADSLEYTTERYRYLMGEQKNLAPQDRFFWTDPTIPELLPQKMLPGSEVPLPVPQRGAPLPSGAMLISSTPFIPDSGFGINPMAPTGQTALPSSSSAPATAAP